MKKYIFLFILCIITLFFGYAYFYAINSPYKISSTDAKQLIQQGKIDIILDVRTDLERETLGYYPGSIHIQSADLDKIMPIKYPNKNIYILAYCNTGQRARAATEKLHKLGYNNSFYIISGYTSLL
jgi:rhodanese-related sulfurtransferase